MKKNLPLQIILFILIGSIGIWIVLANSTSRESQYNANLSEEGESGFAYGQRLSNNGKWFFEGISPSYSITSLDFPFTRYVFNELEVKNKYHYDFYWSPNHPYLFAGQLFIPEKSCAREHFYILEEKYNMIRIKARLNEPLEEPSKCRDARWLWDGTQIALIGLEKQREKYDISIYDMDAKLISEYEYTVSQEDKELFPGGYQVRILPDHGIIFLSIRGEKNNPKAVSRIMYINEKEPDIGNHVIDVQGDYYILAADKINERILLVETIDNKTSHFMVVNINSGDVEKKGEVFSGEYGVHAGSFPVVSLDKRFVAITASPHTTYFSQVLLIWDWETLEFSDKGEIDTLIGWDDQKQGFLVLTRDKESREFSMKWIKPVVE